MLVIHKSSVRIEKELIPANRVIAPSGQPRSPHGRLRRGNGNDPGFELCDLTLGDSIRIFIQDHL